MLKSIDWLVIQNGCLLIVKNPALIHVPTTQDVSVIKTHFLRQEILNESENNQIYCAELDTACNIPANLTLIPLRQTLALLGTPWFNHIVKACSIINWDKNHQYCGRCGGKTIRESSHFERICSACTLPFYPRISPSIIVLIQRSDQLLMARSYHFAPGTYGLIAGFVEIGESVEEAVHREVIEETGITIKNIQYFGSQPWPFPDSLMLAFTAQYASGTLTVNTTELEEANWYRFDHLPGRPGAHLSIANQLIDHFIKSQQNKPPIA